MLEDIAARAHQMILSNGGVTIGLQGHEPKEGYAFSPYPELERVLPAHGLTPAHVHQYLVDNQTALSQPGNHLGAWHDTQSGNVFLDISHVGPATPETIAEAKKANQLAVFDLANFNEIPTGLERSRDVTSSHPVNLYHYAPSAAREQIRSQGLIPWAHQQDEETGGDWDHVWLDERKDNRPGMDTWEVLGLSPWSIEHAPGESGEPWWRTDRVPPHLLKLHTGSKRTSAWDWDVAEDQFQWPQKFRSEDAESYHRAIANGYVVKPHIAPIEPPELDWEHFGAVHPDWLYEWIEKNGPYVVHQTTHNVIPLIHQNGLIPWDAPGMRSIYGDDLRPRPNHVYVRHPSGPMHDYHVHFDLRKLDPERIHADEDSFFDPHSASGVRKLEPYLTKPEVVRDNNRNYRHIQDAHGTYGSFGEWAEHHRLNEPAHVAHSLNEGGTLAIEGGIDPAAIVSPEEVGQWHEANGSYLWAPWVGGKKISKPKLVSYNYPHAPVVRPVVSADQRAGLQAAKDFVNVTGEEPMDTEFEPAWRSKLPMFSNSHIYTREQTRLNLPNIPNGKVSAYPETLGPQFPEEFDLEAPKPATNKQCPHCKWFGRFADVCPQCGYDIQHGLVPLAPGKTTLQDWGVPEGWGSPKPQREYAWQWTSASPFQDFDPGYYHIAPTSERERIRVHGLQPSNPGLSGNWDNVLFDNGWEPAEWGKTVPHGVYVHRDPQIARQYANDQYGNFDVWHVPGHAVQDAVKDPDLAPYYHKHDVPLAITHAVPATLYEPYESTLSDRSWKLRAKPFQSSEDRQDRQDQRVVNEWLWQWDDDGGSSKPDEVEPNPSPNTPNTLPNPSDNPPAHARTHEGSRENAGWSWVNRHAAYPESGVSIRETPAQGHVSTVREYPSSADVSIVDELRLSLGLAHSAQDMRSNAGTSYSENRPSFREFPTLYGIRESKEILANQSKNFSNIRTADWSGPCPHCGNKLWETGLGRYWCRSCGKYMAPASAAWKNDEVWDASQLQTQHPDPWMDNEPGTLTFPDKWRWSNRGPRGSRLAGPDNAPDTYTFKYGPFTVFDYHHDRPWGSGAWDSRRPVIYEPQDGAFSIGAPGDIHADLERFAMGPTIQGSINPEAHYLGGWDGEYEGKAPEGSPSWEHVQDALAQHVQNLYRSPDGTGDWDSSKFSMAADPNWLDNYIQRNGPYLYHATQTPEQVDSLLTHGILPWDHPNNPYGSAHGGGSLEPRPGHVYLKTYTPKRQMDRTVAVDLRKLDPGLLNPDEDNMIGNTPWHFPPPQRSMYEPNETGGSWAERWQMNEPSQTAYSLEGINGLPTVAYRGVIPPEAIHRHIGAKTASPKQSAIGTDIFTCNHCGSHAMTEPKQLGNQWTQTCTACGRSRNVPGTHPLINALRTMEPEYPALLNEVGPQRPMNYFGAQAQITPEQIEALKRGELDLDSLKNQMQGSPEYLYHYAPTSERERIRTHGLQPGQPGLSGHWNNVTEGEQPGWLKKQPSGIYVTKDPKRFGPHQWGMGHKMDLWRIHPDHVKSIEPDPIVDHAFSIPHSVLPELHEPWEDSDDANWHWDARVPQTREDMEWGPINIPGHESENDMRRFYEQKIEGNPWGVGKGTRRGLDPV